MATISCIPCPFCGSLCDDITVNIQDNTIVKVKNACAIGEAKFLSQRHHRLSPMIRKNGKLTKVSWGEAILKSAEILSKASYPILYGWSSTSCEAIRKGLELAEEVGGVIDNTSTVCHGPSVLSIQDIGMSSCTLGQLRHRADLVIYWGSNPWAAHPRHVERYTMFSDGRFRKSNWGRYVTHARINQIMKRFKRVANVIRGYKTSAPTDEIISHLPPIMLQNKRKMIVVDVRKTRSADVADYFLQVKPNSDYELLQALRMLVRNEVPDLEEVAGIPIELLEEFVDVMINCEVGIIFFGVGLTMSSGKLRNIDAALSLVRDLNMRTKFLIMPMRGHFNVTGANVVSTWQTGYPYAVDYSKGYPEYNPGETSVVDILSREESDAGLIIASDPVSNFPRTAVQNLVKNPLIVIDPIETPTSIMADVVLPSTFVGLETPGTAYRMDHVPLPLKKVVNPPEHLLSDEEILQRILDNVKSIKEAETQ